MRILNLRINFPFSSFFNQDEITDRKERKAARYTFLIRKLMAEKWPAIMLINFFLFAGGETCQRQNGLSENSRRRKLSHSTHSGHLSSRNLRGRPRAYIILLKFV